jgi:hypothetical protein
MKKFILLVAGMCFFSVLNAQTWNGQIYRISGNSKVKTVRIKPGMKLDVRSILLDNDSLRITTRYNGSFMGVSGDTMKIRLTDYYEFEKYPDGILKQTTIPGKIYLMPNSSDYGIVSMPLSDIGYLSYRNKNADKMSEIIELPIYLSLCAIILSPFICYDYNDGSFNTERYKYWGLGSTLVLSASFCCEIALSGSKKYQFKPDWPWKNKKVWSFKKGY